MTNKIITIDDHKEILRKIFYDRVKELHQHLLVTSLPAVALCATLVFLALYQTGNKSLVLSWYLTTLLICLVRYGLLKWYEHDLKRPALHLKIFIAGTAISGLMWGFAGTVLTSPHNILNKVFIIIIIAGLNAGGCQTLKASRVANSLFILTSILPVAIWILLQDQVVYTYLSLSIFGYLGFMLFLAHKFYTQFINSLQLHYENEILLKQLILKHAQLKKTNKDLQDEFMEHEKAKDRLKYLASHDFLTGLDNRRSFDSQFARTLILSQIQKSEFCVMYIDVDYFKNINDNYGHDFGDHLLVEVAKKIKRALRTQDTLARIGGDEFVVLMADIKIKKIAEQFCQEIFAEFKNPFIINGHSVQISLSLGGSFFPVDGDNKKTLLKKADVALYQAKNMGRSQYIFYTQKTQILE